MPRPSQCDLISITFIKHKLTHYWRSLDARLHEAEARTPTRPRPRSSSVTKPRPDYLASRPRPFQGLNIPDVYHLFA